MRIEDLLFWRRHKVFARGDVTVIVNYNLLTGRWHTAGYFRDGRLIYTTRDPETLKGWLVNG